MPPSVPPHSLLSRSSSESQSPHTLCQPPLLRELQPQPFVARPLASTSSFALSDVFARASQPHTASIAFASQTQAPRHESDQCPSSRCSASSKHLLCRSRTPPPLFAFPPSSFSVLVQSSFCDVCLIGTGTGARASLEQLPPSSVQGTGQLAQPVTRSASPPSKGPWWASPVPRTPLASRDTRTSNLAGAAVH